MLNDEKVQAAARTYLFEQRIGDVTPQTFRHALNKRILPSLGYSLKSKLSERTAWRWLLKLGWRRKELKKGVYMDSHERSDVVEYCNKVFLTLMAKYERLMAHWIPEGDKLVRVDPVLEPGEKRIIALFQDESCFHVNDNNNTAWYAL